MYLQLLLKQQVLKPKRAQVHAYSHMAKSF